MLQVTTGCYCRCQNLCSLSVRSWGWIIGCTWWAMPLHTSTCCVVPTPSSTENPVFANLSSPCCSDVQAYSSALWHHRWVWLLQVRHTQPHSLVILGLFKSWPISTAVYNTMAQNLSQWQSFHHCDNHKVALYCGRSLSKWNFFFANDSTFFLFRLQPRCVTAVASFKLFLQH